VDRWFLELGTGVVRVHQTGDAAALGARSTAVTPAGGNSEPARPGETFAFDSAVRTKPAHTQFKYLISEYLI